MSSRPTLVRDDESKDVVARLDDIHKSFGDNTVLRGVSLELHRGENLVVLGRSGTGKSVLIKILVGLISPDQGRIELLGRQVLDLDGEGLDELRLHVGFCFQHSALYDSMSVSDNLDFPLRMHRRDLSVAERRDRIEEMLEAVGMVQALHQMPAELSGGQRKRIGVARTLIMQPEVMLYDEPTAGLDPITAKEINDLIIEVRETYGTSSIVITHDLASARQVHDRIAMLDGGQVFAEGTFEEVFASDDPRIVAFYDYNFTGEAHGTQASIAHSGVSS